MKRDKKLARSVLAENITVTPDGEFYKVEFDWLCPWCGWRHWARELMVSNPKQMQGLWLMGKLMGKTATEPLGFSMSYIDCPINVRMPWADETPRDLQSVYGQNQPGFCTSCGSRRSDLWEEVCEGCIERNGDADYCRYGFCNRCGRNVADTLYCEVCEPEEYRRLMESMKDDES